MKNKIYIAGPMTGYPEFNFSAFHEAEKLFEGYPVYNPAKEDEKEGLDVSNTTGKHEEIPLFCLKTAMKRNCIAIFDSDIMYMLRGWEISRGSIAEHSLAVCLGLKIIYQ